MSSPEHKVDTLVRDFSSHRNASLFNNTRDVGRVGGHGSIERGASVLSRGQPPVKTVKKSLVEAYSPDELEKEVLASVQARGGNPNIVNVVAWDKKSRGIITEDLGRCNVEEWVELFQPKESLLYHVLYQMLELVLWVNSRGVFHRDLACDNFVIKGDTIEDIASQRDRPTIGLIDFGAAVVSPAVLDCPDSDAFVAGYRDQWHGPATHGRDEFTDPLERICTVLGMFGIGDGTMNYHLYDLYSWGKLAKKLLAKRGFPGSPALKRLIFRVATADPTKRFHPSVDLRQHEFMVRQKAEKDGTHVGAFVQDKDLRKVLSEAEVARVKAVAGGSDVFQGYSKLVPPVERVEPAVEAMTAVEEDGAEGEEEWRVGTRAGEDGGGLVLAAAAAAAAAAPQKENGRAKKKMPPRKASPATREVERKVRAHGQQRGTLDPSLSSAGGGVPPGRSPRGKHQGHQVVPSVNMANRGRATPRATGQGAIVGGSAEIGGGAPVARGAAPTIGAGTPYRLFLSTLATRPTTRREEVVTLRGGTGRSARSAGVEGVVWPRTRMRRRFPRTHQCGQRSPDG